MGVFTQVNFVAEFIRLNFNFIYKIDRFAYWGVGGNMHSLSIAHRKSRGRLPIMAVTGLFSLALMVETL